MYSIFRNLAIIILSAKFFGLVARKCKAPQVVGEILAGLVIGPCVLNLVQTSDSIATFAEIGVVLMLIYVLFFTDFFDGEKKRKKNKKKAKASHE